MTSYVVALFVAAALLAPARGDSVVMQSSKTYRCCDSPTITFNQQCENTWSKNDQPFAYSKGSSTRCVSPCKKIEEGLMTLDACLPLNTKEVCTNADNAAEEQRTEYLSEPCSASPSVHSHAPGGLLLIGGSVLLLMMKMSC